MRLTTRGLFRGVLWLGLFALAVRNVTDGDFWWHLSTGQYILDSGAIPRVDVFSFTRAGEPWVAHEWLSEVFIAALWRAGGFAALITAFAAIIATAFYLAYRLGVSNEGQSEFATALITLFAAFSTMSLWDVRPQMIGLLLTSITLWALEHYRRNRGSRAVWLLPPMMIVWVNAHGSFIIGPILVGLYLIGLAVEARWPQFGGGGVERKALLRLGGVLALMLLAIPVNPNGIRMLSYPLETLMDPRMQAVINEWQSPDFHRPDMQAFAVLVLATFVAVAWARRPPSATQVLLLAVCLFEALRAVRMMPLFVLAAIPLLGQAVPQFGRVAGASAKGSRVNLAVLGLLAGACLLYASAVAERQAATERALYPQEALEFIERAKLSGPLFNLYEWGGYVIWRAYPEQRVFIDGRADVYGELIPEYLAVYRGAAGWRETLEQYGIRLVLIPPGAPLAAKLEKEGGWQCIYRDAHAAVWSEQRSEYAVQ